YPGIIAGHQWVDNLTAGGQKLMALDIGGAIGRDSRSKMLGTMSRDIGEVSPGNYVLRSHITLGTL
ncbi:hypothetical protein, partial [Arthrobacter sp. N199823]|uniref:hypothetical protein n=1 Tax=Arthrobacter sp. N199823 TaxID=2058895 RepID=UPI001CA51C07